MDRSPKTTAGAVRGALALLLVICLVECTTEQRINNRGGNGQAVERINGWRSQRGGSCLSYGHSCWGAHGKRSGQPPASAPDWYLTRLLRKIASSEIENSKQLRENNDIAAIFRGDATDDSADANKITDDESPDFADAKRRPEGIPMLDDSYLSKSKFWKLMKSAATADEK